MSSVRVEAILDAISQLSTEEQLELAHDLPRVLRAGSQSGYPSAEAVRHVIQIRERIRQRLVAAGQSHGFADEDLDAVRNERLNDLSPKSDLTPDQRS
jgi:hypothetical protein